MPVGRRARHEPTRETSGVGSRWAKYIAAVGVAESTRVLTVGCRAIWYSCSLQPRNLTPLLGMGGRQRGKRAAREAGGMRLDRRNGAMSVCRRAVCDSFPRGAGVRLRTRSRQPRGALNRAAAYVGPSRMCVLPRAAAWGHDGGHGATVCPRGVFTVTCVESRLCLFCSDQPEHLLAQEVFTPFNLLVARWTPANSSRMSW